MTFSPQHWGTGKARGWTKSAQIRNNFPQCFPCGHRKNMTSEAEIKHSDWLKEVTEANQRVLCKKIYAALKFDSGIDSQD